MPWVTTFNYEAKIKKDEYQHLENVLINYTNQINSHICESINCLKRLETITEDMGNLVGEYMEKYMNKKEDYFDDFKKIKNNFATFQQALKTSITQCNRKKLEWDALIWTEEWEPEEEKYVRD